MGSCLMHFPALFVYKTLTNCYTRSFRIMCADNGKIPNIAKATKILKRKAGEKKVGEVKLKYATLFAPIENLSGNWSM